MNTYRKIALASMTAFIIVFAVYVAANVGSIYGFGEVIVENVHFGSDERVYWLDLVSAIPVFGYVLAGLGCYWSLWEHNRSEFAKWLASFILLWLAFGALNEVRVDILRGEANLKIALIVLIWGSKIAFLTSSAFWLGLFEGGVQRG